MRNLWGNLLLAGFVLGAVVARADERLDREFAFRSLVTFMIGSDKYPVFGTSVEKAMAQTLRANPRFQYSDTASVWAQENLPQLAENFLKADLSRETSRFLTPFAQEFHKQGVDSFVVSQLKFSPIDGYRLRALFVNSANGLVLHETEATLPAGSVLEAFEQTARDLTKDLITRIPFEANVVSREGSRVVLDQGQSRFRKGMRVQAVTLEPGEKDALIYKETGTLQITHADRNLAFARIVVENLPLRVSQANKIRSVLSELPEKIVPAPPVLTRAVAAESGDVSTSAGPSSASASVVEVASASPAGRLGWVEAGLSPTAFSLEETLATGTPIVGSSLMMLAFKLRSQLWITRSLFIEAGLGIAKGSVFPTGLQSSASVSSTQLRFMGGYRYEFRGGLDGLMVYGKGGFSSQSYGFGAVEPSTVAPSILTDLSFSGFWVGGGARYRLDVENALELEVGTLLLRGFSEGPQLSGSTVEGSANYEMVLRYTRRYLPGLDLNAALGLNYAGANFSGRGTRAIPASSITAVGKSLLLSATYSY